MLYIVIAVILLIIGVIGLLVRGAAPEMSDDMPAHRADDAAFQQSLGTVIATLGFVALVVWTFAMAATTVSARSVGIQTAFGRYQSTLPAGKNGPLPATWTCVSGGQSGIVIGGK